MGRGVVADKSFSKLVGLCPVTSCLGQAILFLEVVGKRECDVALGIRIGQYMVDDALNDREAAPLRIGL